MVHALVRDRPPDGLFDDGGEALSQLDLARVMRHVEQVINQTRHLADLTFQHFGCRSGALPVAERAQRS
jgi:hypothetical protein